MKISQIIFLLFCSTILLSCTTVKYLSLTDGSKSDGTLKFSYDKGGFEKPDVQWKTAKLEAEERCKSWGYTGAEFFENGTSECLAYNQYGCVKWRYTYLCQCIGDLPSKQIIIQSTKNNGTKIELTQKEKAIKELKDAKELLDLDIITQDEFQKKSDKLKPIILAD